MSDNVDAAACQKNVKRSKDNTIFRIVIGGKGDNDNCLVPLKLVIGQTCPNAADGGDDQLDTENINMVGKNRVCEIVKRYVRPLVHKKKWLEYIQQYDRRDNAQLRINTNALASIKWVVAFNDVHSGCATC